MMDILRRIHWSQVIVAFLLGSVLTGSIIRWKHGRWHDPSKRHQWMLNRFSSRMNLDSEQKAKVEEILKKKRESMEALHTEAQPRFEEIRQNARAEIRAVLRPDQVEKFEKWEKKMEERRKERRGKMGPMHWRH